MIKAILIDIEGTTSPVTFVKEVLFPYADARIAEFVQANAHPQIEEVILQTLETIRQEEHRQTDTAGAIAQLKKWIAEDRKHPALKKLQGWIWKQGYEDGTLRSHLYADVLPALKKWKSEGYRLSVYSSGSVEAQQLFYAHTDEGDISSLWENLFDTSVGGKKEADSYKHIARLLSVTPPEVLFLSDVEGELTAATQAEMQVYHVVREGTQASAVFPVVRSFDEIVIQ